MMMRPVNGWGIVASVAVVIALMAIAAVYEAHKRAACIVRGGRWADSVAVMTRTVPMGDGQTAQQMVALPGCVLPATVRE
jgi:uncharacterized membrane protein YjdF